MSTRLCSLPPSTTPFDHWDLRLAEWDDRIEMVQRNEVADGLLFHFTREKAHAAQLVGPGVRLCGL